MFCSTSFIKLYVVGSGGFGNVSGFVNFEYECGQAGSINNNSPNIPLKLPSCLEAGPMKNSDSTRNIYLDVAGYKMGVVVISESTGRRLSIASFPIDSTPLFACVKSILIASIIMRRDRFSFFFLVHKCGGIIQPPMQAFVSAPLLYVCGDGNKRRDGFERGHELQ